MCKNTCKKIYGFISAVLLSLTIFSCSQEPIFWAINQEIKLVDPSIKGNVYSVVRSGNSLYTANGNIYKKPLKSERGWEKISKPAGNAVYLASSNSHVYALSANGETVTVYALAAAGGDWQQVPGASGKADEVVIFDNGVSGTGRNAYVRVGGKVYKLNGTAPVSGISPETAATGAGSKTLAAAQVSGTDYFADTRAFCSDGTNLYMASGTTIKKGTSNSDLANTSVSTSETITGLAYDEKENRLIAGTKKGLEAIILNGGDPQSTALLGANAEAAIGESEIFSVACFGAADNNAIYAGVGRTASSKNNALWGYYPSRGNWNYE